MKESTKTILRITIAVVLVLVSGYFAVKDIDFNKLWEILKNADYFWVLLPIPVILLSHWVRAVRWKTMLTPIINATSTWNLFSAVMVGYFLNGILPRGGEFLRPYVYARRERISFSSTLATIIVERFLDVIFLILLFGGVFFFFREQLVQALPNLHAEKFMVPTAIVLLVILLSFYPPIFKFFIRILIKPFSNKIYDRVSELFNKFLKGFAVIKSPTRYIRLLLESLAIWLLYTIPMYLIFFSFSFQSQLHLGFDDAILLIVVSGIGTTIAPVPGAFGVYHYFISNTMTILYGISMEESLAYATLTHIVNYFVQIAFGGIFFLRENIAVIPKKDAIENNLEVGNSISNT